MTQPPTKKVPVSAKRRPPAAGKGRPKGALNKTTTIAKDAIARAADGLGGTERLIAWAQENTKNEHAFWTTIYPKLLPLQVDANVNGQLGLLPSAVVDDLA
jgi:hypothetical protein